MLYIIYLFFNINYYYFCEKVEFWPFLGPWVNACPDPLFGGFWWEPDFDVFLMFLHILYNLFLFLCNSLYYFIKLLDPYTIKVHEVSEKSRKKVEFWPFLGS